MNMQSTNRLINGLKSGLLQIQGFLSVKCIKNSLVMMIPILMIGSFSLVAISLPVTVYQEFINKFGWGIILQLLQTIYAVSFGGISLFMTVSMAISYTRLKKSKKSDIYGPVLASIVSFCIFSGLFNSEVTFDINTFGVTGMFTAIVCGLGAPMMYSYFKEKRETTMHLYSEGADTNFNSMLQMITPMLLVTIIFAAMYQILADVFGVTSFQMLFANSINEIFSNMGNTIGTAILFHLMANILWFFGIHGSNVLESVNQNVFVPAIEINQQLVNVGQQPTEIFSKTFFDVFVIMGGSGATICLLLAILLFSKRRSSKNIAKFASIPMIFNINEMMIFGLPICYNSIFLVPFLLVPIVLIIISYAAMQLGLVPIPVNAVEWTTPVFLGGYIATGSIAGSILQFVNIIIGVLIYLPFVKMYDKDARIYDIDSIKSLVQIVKESEETRQTVELLSRNDMVGDLAKNLADELVKENGSKLPTVHYQPQYNKYNICIGAESLVYWNHSVYGNVYPPLIFKLAEETDMLIKYEKDVFRAVVRDMDKLSEILGSNAKISINVTGKTIQTDEYEEFLLRQSKKYPSKIGNIMIEVTEQAALEIDDKLIERLTRIKNMGYRLAIDDFTMGSTSVKYLQTNIFSLLKLDGQISKGVMDNDRNIEIIASITKLAHDFGIDVLAEYVESEEQKKILEGVGCNLYQGYLYGTAVPIDELAKQIEN